ncbi:hypothetical protein Bca52824_033535 [Brassica carinata]|uniref:Uncharacterized protein n=1 Tax=Brassica carinata TaxID=52824 RepID=A0A8X7SIX8_BRACI|nr:hypothetical protein Bca52824_033535 [Brassica carinata]
MRCGTLLSQPSGFTFWNASGCSSPVVNKNKLSREAAWNEYDKPIDDLTLYIPSRSTTPRFTPTFCDWWKVSFPQLLQHSLKEKGDMSRRWERRKRVSQNNDEEDDSLTDVSVSLCKRCRLAVADSNYSGLPSTRADVDKPVTQPEVEQRKETGSKAGKRIVLSLCDETNPSHPLSALGGAIGIAASPPETTKSCDDELGVCGSSVEKMTLVDYVTKKTECSLHDDGVIAEEKEIHQEEDDDSLIQTKLARNETDNNELSPQENLASGGANGDETRKTCDDELGVLGSNGEKMAMTGESSKDPENLLHEDVSMAGEKVSSNEKEDDKRSPNADKNEPITLQKRASGGPNGDETSDEPNIHNAVGEGDVSNDSNGKSKQNWKVLASSVEERIAMAERDVAWLKARKAAKQKKIAAAARLIKARQVQWQSNASR